MARKTFKKKIFLDELPKWKTGGCKGKINWKESIGYKIKFIYGDVEGLLEIVNYYKNKQQLDVKYDNKCYKILTSSLMICRLGKIVNIVTGEFKCEIGQTFKNDKRDLIITDREYRLDKAKIRRKWYKYTCNVCGWTEGWIDESALLNGNGCSCCCGRTAVLGINTIWDTDKWLISIINDDEFCKTHTYGCKESIYPTCPNCGIVINKKIQIYSIYAYGVPCTCKDNIPYDEKFMHNILNQLMIEFSVQYSPDWIKPKAYDFYIPSMNLIIEMDGGFHTKDNNMSGQTREESKAIDNYKDRLANEHGIKVIRIDCNYDDYNKRFEYIKQNILESKLNKLFDLNKIDWLRVDEFALSNLVKIACEFWSTKQYSLKDISKIMKLSEGTIRNYVTTGTKHNWCYYNGTEEKAKNYEQAKIRKTNAKAIICITNEIVFESATDCERKSVDVFGVKLNHKNISQVCNNDKKTCRGLTFKFLSRLTPEEYIKYDIESKLKELNTKTN